MTVSDALQQTWGHIKNENHDNAGYYHRRIPVQSALPAHAGIVFPLGNFRISLLADNAAIRGISLRDETRGYSVDIELSPAGYPHASFIHITAKMDAFSAIFIVLATDILDLWKQQSEAGPAVMSIQRRLDHWRRFFQRSSEGLSREEYIGLYAELVFLKALMDAGIEPYDAANAWQGPLGTNQDFLFGSKAIEVKSTTGNNPDSVRISNERQLDSSGLSELFIFHIAFDFRENAGRTLSQLVIALRERLKVLSEPALFLFEERLLAAGHSDQVSSPYDKYGFTERKRGIYRFRKDSPVLSNPGYHLELMKFLIN